MNILRKIVHKYFRLVFITALLFILIFSCNQIDFDDVRALGYTEKQLSFGYRIPGSQASRETSLFIQQVLEENGWTVSFQDFVFEGTQLRNIIAFRKNSAPELILGAHYDTRQISNMEDRSVNQLIPVRGANDGASGTALLLELSHHLGQSDRNIWLVFFDAEDQGSIEGWPWSVGAEYFASKMESSPEKVVIVDMIGDKDLEIYREKNSTKDLTDEIWTVAEDLGFQDIFINQPKYALIDDHMPFLNRAIPSALIIDFDYPYWHTNNDTLDKVSGESLKIVGEVILEWVMAD